MDVKIRIFLIWFAIFFQIILLAGFSCAQSYNVHNTDGIIEEIQLKQKQNMKLIQFLKSAFSIKQIGSASAEMINQTYEFTNYAEAEYSTNSGSWNCCAKTNEGAICQNVPSNYDECSSQLIQTKCENSVECKSGCCIDDKEGICSTSSIKKSCEEENGIWKDEKNCDILECQKACCVVGKNTFFVTEARCDLLSSLYGIEKDFRDLKNEIECLRLSSTQPIGACILTENSCKFVRKSECLSMNGKFFENLLCSNPSLNTNCKKQNSVECIDGKDEVYWIDSCGNRENIFDSDKEKSWNNGEVLKKEESCKSDSSNINSKNCGNCNYFLGSKCEALSTGAVCKSLNCVDENGKTRMNGESWCAYDGFVGDGKDVVGSRHWKNICIDGKIKVEACADYRGQICIESKIENDGKNFSTAGCVINFAMKCTEYNSESETLEENCKENSQCDFREIDIDEGFKFNLCTPKYPRGFDLSYETGAESAKEICGMADQTCVAIYEKKIDGGWKCIFNCDCESKKFTQQMNDFCVSLGDCGSYVNILGKGTDSYEVKNAPKISWKNYSSYAKPVKGQYIPAPNLSEILEQMGLLKPGQFSLEENSVTVAVNLLGQVAGGLGTVYTVASFASTGSLVMTPTWALLASSSLGVSLPAVAGAASAIAIGTTVGVLLSMAFGLQGDAAMVMAVAGLVGGIVIAVATWGQGGLAACIGPQIIICAVVLIILILLAVALKIFGIGDTKEVKVKFTCLPWQAPFGGEDCAKCDDNFLKPCSKYRCESLGLECKLLNSETEHPVCAQVSSNDNLPPTITPLEINENFKFEEAGENKIAIRNLNGECVPEFTPVNFKIQTDKFSQCRFDYQEKENYDDMEEFFLEQNSFSKNHTNIFMMPSLQSIAVYNLTGDIIQRFGNLNMFVKCVDTYGNENKRSYLINFCIQSGKDITPAYITTSIPVNNAVFKKNLTEIPLKIFLNEPAECRVGLSEINYFDMTKKMECKTGLTEYENFGWTCSITLDDLKKENKFYIKCRDQPWLGENSTRNVNTDGFVISLNESKSELKINSISPSGKITNGMEPISVELKVSTSGGMNDGKSACYYSVNDDKNYIQFYNTFSNEHSQTLDSLLKGDYKIFIKCVDEAGNKDFGFTELILDLDTNAPIVTRTYNDGGMLKILTDERAECYYTFNKCNFDFASAESMTTGFSTEHETEWQTEFSYYIKCKDIWGNSNTNCAIVVRPEMIN